MTESTSMDCAPQPDRIDSDEQLLVQYRQTGHRELFAELVRRYERELFNYLRRRYLGDPGMAEDAFQATFLQVHLKCEQFEEGRRFRPWLYTIATNQAIDAQRRNKRHRMVSLDRMSGCQRRSGKTRRSAGQRRRRSAGPGDALRTGRMGPRSGLDELSDQMRSVVQLVYYEGMKYREAADVWPRGDRQEPSAFGHRQTQ